MICDNQIAGIIDFFEFSHCRGPIQARHISYTDASFFRRWIAEQLSRIETNISIDSASQAHAIAIATFPLFFSVFATLNL